MSKRIDLSELLRDADEIRDLLTAYGEQPDEDAASNRERLLAIVGLVGETRIIATLFEYAQGFARMLEEILGFLEEQGVRIQGQIQLKSEGLLEKATPLQTHWIRGGARFLSTDLTSFMRSRGCLM